MPTCDHVALVLPKLEPALQVLSDLGLPAGPVEEFPGEGTREVYLGAEGQAARLLLLQPLGGEGPYARALEKRGPGLHHLAVRVPSIEAFLAECPGWLLVPRSLELFGAGRTVWLARPGVGTLVEVQQASEWPSGPAVVERVEVEAREMERASGLLSALGTDIALAATASAPTLTVAGRVLPVRRLTGDSA